MPTIAVDYMFMNASQRAGGESAMPILVAHDKHHDECGMLFACVVPQKGVIQYAVKSLSNFVALLGYNQFVFRSDGELAIVALKQVVRAERPERIVLEESLVRESKSNSHPKAPFFAPTLILGRLHRPQFCCRFFHACGW